MVHEIGHVLGLFHTGPYNGNVDPLTQQFNATDSRQWSIMSYIDPWQQSAYSADYTYTDTSWGRSPQGYPGVPTTTMPLDVLAAQRLYGMPADTPLSGGQVFGFHCNIGGAIEPFFDFTVNTAPVVTLWDEGSDNVLDLSGFAGAATVDLEPGTFSSADGMTDNIGIAYGTRIDGLVGPSGGATVTLNGDSDTIEGTGGVNVALLTASDGLYAVDPTGTSSAVVRAATGVVDLLLGVQQLDFTGGDNTVVGEGFGTFDLAGGGNLLFLEDRSVSVQSAGADTIVGGSGDATVAASGTLGSVIFGTTGALTVAGGGGMNTVVTGSAGGLVDGGAGGAFVWAAGPLVYLGGAGAGTVAADATAAVTVRAGGGGRVLRRRRGRQPAGRQRRRRNARRRRQRRHSWRRRMPPTTCWRPARARRRCTRSGPPARTSSSPAPALSRCSAARARTCSSRARARRRSPPASARRCWNAMPAMRAARCRCSGGMQRRTGSACPATPPAPRPSRSRTPRSRPAAQ